MNINNFGSLTAVFCSGLYVIAPLYCHSDELQLVNIRIKDVNRTYEPELQQQG